MQDKHRGRVANGILWSAIERFSVQGIQFFLSIVIARLISPSDYGLIAMLSIFLAVAQQFVDSGFANALVQKKDRSDVDFSTVFYANLIIAVVAYAALYVAAPWIADFYSEPKLIAVTRWVGLTVVLMAFSIVQRAKLTIELDFKEASPNFARLCDGQRGMRRLARMGRATAFGRWSFRRSSTISSIRCCYGFSLVGRCVLFFLGLRSVRFFRSGPSCWSSAYCTFFIIISIR